jgi:hypothetical protein
MRRALVSENDGTCCICFGFGGTLAQLRHVMREPVKLLLLAGDDIGQVFDGAGEVGNAYFKGFAHVRVPLLAVAGRVAMG